MTKEAILRTAVLFGFILSFVSSFLAFFSGGDIIFIIFERFFLVLIVSAMLVWITLTTINLVVIGAAKRSLDELARSLDKQETEPVKNSSVDFTSMPEENNNLSFDQEDFNKPEIKEFEPLRPGRLETDDEY